MVDKGLTLDGCCRFEVPTQHFAVACHSCKTENSTPFLSQKKEWMTSGRKGRNKIQHKEEEEEEN